MTFIIVGKKNLFKGGQNYYYCQGPFIDISRLILNSYRIEISNEKIVILHINAIYND